VTVGRDFTQGIERIARVPRWGLFVGLAAVTAFAGAFGLVRATNAQLDKVARIPEVSQVLSPASDNVENYLLVGSDSRASIDPSDPDFASIGSTEDAGGQRSDSMIVMRYDKKEKSVALMSIPRDLWAAIGVGEKKDRINVAYQEGSASLVRTVQRALNIPIHHYMEIDFGGFREMVDAVGGVRICFEVPSRDQQTGFVVARPGCPVLSGKRALAYTRARYFQQKIDGEWREDPSRDIGRSTRQREFITALMKQAASYATEHPFEVEQLMDAFAANLKVDSNLSLVDMARKLRPAASGDVSSYTLPTENDMVGDKAVLQLTQEAPTLLAYFAGTGPAPQIPTE
jgi:LCP family protein required for cell wall assembly